MACDSEEHDKFKELFKYYKSRNSPPSFESLIKVELYDERVLPMKHNVQEDLRCESLGLINCSKWKSYTFNDHPGLIFISNPFTPFGQRYWSKQCLEVYPRKPNKTNIDNEIYLDDWWNCCHRNKEVDYNLINKLRWTTLGYHHNWDTKVYCDADRCIFPEDLAELCDIIASYLGFNKFQSEAAIVNYYHMDSTLSPHTDHSEINLEAPLLSISFGQSAVFLIGGQKRSISPSALLLNSGDIVVMSSDSRLSYHAVPKILPASRAPWNDVDTINTYYSELIKYKFISDPNRQLDMMNSNVNDAEWEQFNNYITDSRININIRQVLYETKRCILDC